MNFEYWSLDNPTLDLQCTAPIGTASGAMMVAQFTDPLNSDVPSDAASAFQKFGNTLGSVIIRPRDNKSLKIDISANALYGSWRFTKIDTDNPRTSSFGNVTGIILEPGAIGDGTTYTGWLTGHLLGKRRTLITGGVSKQMYLGAKLFYGSTSVVGIRYEEDAWVLQHRIDMVNTTYGKDFPILNCPLVAYLPSTVVLKLKLSYAIDGIDYVITYDLPVNSLRGLSSTTGKTITFNTPLPLLSEYPPDSAFILDETPATVPITSIVHFTYYADPALLRLSLSADETFIPKHKGAIHFAPALSTKATPKKTQN
jgi:hypothetical protein